MRRVTVLLVALLLGACSQNQDRNERVVGDRVIRDASVERVEVERRSASSSLRVSAGGNLYACESLYETEGRREGGVFLVRITVSEPSDLSNVSCEAEPRPFTEEVNFEADLPSGAYTVNVNEVTETFTLP